MTDTSTNTIIVTIDGPAGSGKSTAAKTLAKRLQFEFLDTGAMYRAVAWKCMQSDIDAEDEAAASKVAESLKIIFESGRVLVDGHDATAEIRTSAVSNTASLVAQHPSVREQLVTLQRQSASHSNTVTEGRDQGTIVFPRARCKFFLTARPEVRAQRRFDEMPENEDRPAFEELVKEIKERDERDANRSIAPLKPAPDADVIDTSDSTLDEVVELMEQKVRQQTALD